MTEELLVRGFLPSTPAMAIGMGALAAVVGVLLVQRAARSWLYENRTQELRQRVSRAESRLREAS